MEPPKNTPETAPTERPPAADPAGADAQRPRPATGAAAAPHAEADVPPPVDAAARTELSPSGGSALGDGWIGRVLDQRYRITERLGEGGMGAVFIAEHLKLHKSVAIKVIRAELAGNGEVAARFAREAMATARFEHPHVASAIDFGTLSEGGAYLVMQLVRGQNLRALIESLGKVPWPLACELLAQVADALSAARGAGIVHRDLKPENILVETREDGSRLAKILDFGIAHVAPHAHAEHGTAPLSRQLTRVGTVMGTPGYMSPEQAVGDKVDHRTDLYALGVVLWECLAGQVLWDGPDITSIITRQLREPVPRLRDTFPGLRVPLALDELIQRLCARSADDRPEHAGLVRDELRVLAHTRSSDAPAWERVREVLPRARRYWHGLPGQTRALAALGSLATVLAILALSTRSAPAPNPVAPALPPTAAGQAQPSPSGMPAEPSLVQKALRAVVGEKAPRAPPKPAIPPELKADVQQMQQAERQVDRRKAATRVLAYPGVAQLPAYVRAIATLEEARSCRDRKDAIAAMVALGDPRCLPPLRRLADSSRSGCGFLSLEDCYGCIRGDLRKAITALEAKTPLPALD